MQPVIIGTAGHIDHGKTALVKALTGTDTDRLKEEKARGITIELGYAFLTDRIAFIDVPGHERFIKNMVAGTATVDFALLVVAADDGIMPQTREHFDILRLLGVSYGVVAVTKCDLVDTEWVDLVEEEIREMVAGTSFEGCPILRVDSLSGRGISDLRAALVARAEEKRERVAGAIFRLPVDRVFSVKGFGTVVTGSALSGKVSVDDPLVLLPGGIDVRVRGIESQGTTLTSAEAGMRVALNLPQIGVDDISRGDVLVTPGQLKPTYMLDVECHVLESSPVPLEQRQRVRMHIGTKEVMGRAVILEGESLLPGDTGFVQFRLEAMIAQQRLDRFVIRRYSPQITIGGGRVLDANPGKHRKRHEAAVLGTLRQLGDEESAGPLETIVRNAGVLTRDELVVQSGLPADRVEEAVGVMSVEGRLMELESKGKQYLCSYEAYNGFVRGISRTLEKYHIRYPLRAGAKKGEILGRFKKEFPDFLTKYFVSRAVSDGIITAIGGDLVALGGFEVKLSEVQRNLLEALEETLTEAGFQPPDIGGLARDLRSREDDIRPLVELLVEKGALVWLDGKFPFAKTVVEKGLGLLRSAFEKEAELSMSDFRTLVGTTRKYAVPLLNYYDNQGYTNRRGDARVRGPNL